MLCLYGQWLHFYAHALDSEHFTISIHLQSFSLTKVIHVVCSSSTSSHCKTFYNYSTWKVEEIKYVYRFAEISFLGDFNVHVNLWLSRLFKWASGRTSRWLKEQRTPVETRTYLLFQARSPFSFKMFKNQHLIGLSYQNFCCHWPSSPLSQGKKMQSCYIS